MQKKIANHLGYKNNLLVCKKQEARDILPILPNYFDEPFADVSAIPSILLSKFASENVKVVLSADGGDEIFAGYDNYKRAIQYTNKFSFLANYKFSSNLLKEVSRFIPENKPRISFNLVGLANILEESNYKKNAKFLHQFSQKNSEFLVNKLFKEPIFFPDTYFTTLFSNLQQPENTINNMLAIDYKTYLADNILVKTDRATMSASIEGREPLLDHRIIEYAARLPEEFKMNNHQQKIILKEICHDSIPKELIDGPKQGFTLPLYKWLSTDLKEFSHTYLSTEKCNKYNLFSPKFVDYIRTEFFKGNKHYQDMAWQIISFNNWADYWL